MGERVDWAIPSQSMEGSKYTKKFGSQVEKLQCMQIVRNLCSVVDFNAGSEQIEWKPSFVCNLTPMHLSTLQRVQFTCHSFFERALVLKAIGE